MQMPWCFFSINVDFTMVTIYKWCNDQLVFQIFTRIFFSTRKNSRVAQWKRAGPITQRSVDRNYALLSSFSSFLRENNWYVMNPKKIAWFFPNSRMQDSTLSFQNDENYYFFLQIKICSRLSSTHLTFHVIL